MFSYHSGRTFIKATIISLILLTTLRADANVILTDSKLTLSAGVAQAKQRGVPLIILGTNPGCHNCEGVKKAIESSSELRLLLGQYVAVEISAGSPEASTLIKKTLPSGSGGGGFATPLVIIFTAKGDTAFASHVTPLPGLSLDSCKEVLITGIKKNGGLRDPSKSNSSANLSSDISKAQKLLKENQILPAASMILKYVSTDSKSATDELAKLVKITKLEIAKSKSDEQLTSLVNELSEKAAPLVEAATAKVKTDEPTRVAVQLAALERAFGNYPKFAGKFDPTWKELLDKAKIPNLKEQAKLIDDARQIDASSNVSKAIAAFELVTKTYPDTKAAELAQLRIKQIKAGSTK